MRNCENLNLICACSMANSDSLFKVSNGTTRAVCKIYSKFSKLAIKV